MVDSNQVSIEQIREWLKLGKAEGATHVVVFRDTFDGSTYPTNVMPGEDVKKIAFSDTSVMRKLVEVYNLDLNIEEQLREFRALNMK